MPTSINGLSTIKQNKLYHRYLGAHRNSTHVGYGCTRLSFSEKKNGKHSWFSCPLKVKQLPLPFLKVTQISCSQSINKSRTFICINKRIKEYIILNSKNYKSVLREVIVLYFHSPSIEKKVTINRRNTIGMIWKEIKI